MMWDQGCKGGTVYRDKSRDEQVLYTKDTAVQVAKEVAPLADIPMIDKCTGRIELVDHDAVMPRLDFGLAALFSEEGPLGTVHVGVRHDPVTGEPADLFIASGYGDIGADMQAIGRLCSLILRLKGAKISQVSKLALIQEQLQGIPGRTQSGFAHELRLSMPDTIAHILGRYSEGSFPLANMPLGAEHIDSIFGDFAKIDPEARRDMIAYLKNQSRADTEALRAQLPHDPVAAARGKLDFCPECGGATLLVVPGKCSACRACGYSRC
jgi:ribonucleoside-diphosphate reductase alpha chain